MLSAMQASVEFIDSISQWLCVATARFVDSTESRPLPENQNGISSSSGSAGVDDFGGGGLALPLGWDCRSCSLSSAAALAPAAASAKKLHRLANHLQLRSF
jgi:hypothetical protein